MVKKTRKTSTEKQRQKDSLKELFPRSVEVMGAILNDELKDKRGVKMKVTAKMMSDVANRVVDQTLGRAPQSVAAGGDADLPPIKTLEVRKSYVNNNDAPTESAATVDPELTSAGERPEGNEGLGFPVSLASRQSWLKTIEDEANAATIPADA